MKRARQLAIGDIVRGAVSRQQERLAALRDKGFRHAGQAQPVGTTAPAVSTTARSVAGSDLEHVLGPRTSLGLAPGR